MTSALVVAEQLRLPAPGGIATYVRGLVRGFRDLGDDAPEAVLYASRPPAGEPDPIAALGLPLRRSRLPSRAMVLGWDRGLVDVPAAFPVVHATSMATPPARRSVLVVTVHDLAWRHTPESFPRRGRRWHEAAFRRVVDRADAVIVDAAWVGEEVVASGVERERLHVVPFGCDHLGPPDEDAARRLLERAGVRGDFVLAVGTLEPRKNLRRLVSAHMAARRQLAEPVPLVVAGPAGWGPSLPDLTGDDAGAVVLLGSVNGPPLAGLYRLSRALVYVPLLEGFGLPPLEAMVAGAPVVASPVPSTGDAALEVDPLDEAAIADAIVRVCTEEALRAELSAAGRAHAADFTWSRCAAATAAVYRAAGAAATAGRAG